MPSKNVRAALALGALLLTPAACARDEVPTSPRLDQSALLSGKTALAAKDATAKDTTSKDGATSTTTTAVDAEFMTCTPLAPSSVTMRVGRDGGKIKVGPHELTIPANALRSGVDITATIPAGSVREVEFAPHGLVFRTDVQLVMDYDGCIPPASGKILVVYTGDNNEILAEQLSVADKELKKVKAYTNHFSGYAVAVGRQY